MINVNKLFLLILLLTALLPTFAQQPNPRVQTEYVKDKNKTMIAADILYVSNTASQFVQLQLRALTWGKKPLLPAEITAAFKQAVALCQQ
jgi:hypothetical protein